MKNHKLQKTLSRRSFIMEQDNPMRQLTSATFKTNNKVDTSLHLAADEAAEQSFLQYNNESFQLDLFTVDAIQTIGSDKYFYFSPHLADPFPINASTRASGYKLHLHIHKHGLLRVLKACFVGAFKVTLEKAPAGEKGIYALWEMKEEEKDKHKKKKEYHKVHIKKPEEALMVKLAVAGANIVSMFGGGNMQLLQNWIRHQIACCVTTQSAPYFPVYNIIHKLALDILQASEEVSGCPQKTVKEIIKKCQEFIKIHKKFRKRLRSTANQSAMLPYKDYMREAQQMMVATLLEIEKWDEDKHAHIAQFFVDHLRIKLDASDKLKDTLQEVIKHDCFKFVEPIIKYQSISDIQNWEAYHEYCKAYGIKLEHRTLEDIQHNPQLFHLINRLIIEHAVALKDEDKRIYEWDKLTEKAMQEKASLQQIVQLVMNCITRLCTHLYIAPWTRPEDIDFKLLHTLYDDHEGPIKETLTKGGKLKESQVHNFLELAKFTLESGRLGYYRIPVPAENGLKSADDEIQALIDSLEGDEKHTPIFLQRFSYTLCLLTMMTLL